MRAVAALFLVLALGFSVLGGAGEACAASNTYTDEAGTVYGDTTLGIKIINSAEGITTDSPVISGNDTEVTGNTTIGIKIVNSAENITTDSPIISTDDYTATGNTTIGIKITNSAEGISGDSPIVSGDETATGKTTLGIRLTDSSDTSNLSTEFTITWNPNGGTWTEVSTDPITTSEKSGAQVKGPNNGLTPKKTGYDFVGWNTDKDAETGSKTVTITGDATYYAIWKIATYQIVYDKNVDDDSVTSFTITGDQYYTATYNETFNFPGVGSDGVNIVRTGYVLAGWAVEKTATEPNFTAGSEQVLIGDNTVCTAENVHDGYITLYAIWTEQIGVTIPSQVSFNFYLSSGESDLVEFDVVSNSGVALSLSAYAKAGDDAEFVYPDNNDGMTLQGTASLVYKADAWDATDKNIKLVFDEPSNTDYVTVINSLSAGSATSPTTYTGHIQLKSNATSGWNDNDSEWRSRTEASDDGSASLGSLTSFATIHWLIETLDDAAG